MRRSRAVLLLVMLGACAGGGDTSSGFSSQSGTSPTGVSSLSGASSGATGSSGIDTPTGTGDDGSTGSTSAPTTAGSDPNAATTPNPDGLPDGSECSADSECMTGNCYAIPLPVDGLPPGICSQCDADIDCTLAGLGTACTVDPVDYAGKCTDGPAGSFCETQAACQPGLFCVELVEGAAGLLPLACSECRDDADCGDGDRCVPIVDVDMITGQKHCAAPGSVPIDGLCPLLNGDDMCQSNSCGALDLGGLRSPTVCSPPCRAPG